MSASTDETPSAAVAIVHTSTQDPEFLLLQRSRNPADPWSGHFAFPGGRKECGDEDLLATCIRECHEECGVSLNRQGVKQVMRPAWAGQFTNTEVLVQPYVFEVECAVELVLDKTEIAAGHWVRASFLICRDNRQYSPFVPTQPNRSFPYIMIGNGRLWGFTLNVLDQYLSQMTSRG